MKKTAHSTLALLVALLASITPAFAENPPQPGNEGESVLVGRISHVEGSVLRYIPEEREWERTVKDTPFGLEDRLRTDRDARVEVILPNNTWVRVDEASQLELVSLKSENTEIHMAYGEARYFNKSSDSDIIVTTPFGHVMSPPQTSFDLYVREESAEIVPLKGSIFFAREGDRSKHEVIAGSGSLIADEYSVAAGTGNRDPRWDAWNADRDNLWARRMRGAERSAKYLPPQIHDQAYVLEDYGVWDRVYYNGHYGYLWRPLHVGVEWAPFTVGRWAVWYGDHVWIPAEPYGYVTHHYGNWVYVGRHWYWAPPAVAIGVHVGHPGISISFGWYPGRVAWVHSDIHIGWVPLAPHEPYYSRRHWGPRTIVVKDVRVTNVHVHNYTNVRHTVVVKNDRFYRVDNYKNHRVRHIDQRTIVNQYRAAPVVERKMVVEKGRDRYSFSPRDTERRQENVSRGNGAARPVAARPDRLESPTTGSDVQRDRRRESGGSRSTPSGTERKAVLEGDRPGRPERSGRSEDSGRLQTQQDRVEDRGKPEAVRGEGGALERRSADEPAGAARTRGRSGGGEIQRPSGRDLPRPGGGDLQRPSSVDIQRPAGGAPEDRVRRGEPAAGNPRPGEPERDVRRETRGSSSVSPFNNREFSTERQPRSAQEDRRSGPGRGPNQELQVRPEKADRQRGEVADRELVPTRPDPRENDPRNRRERDSRR